MKKFLIVVMLIIILAGAGAGSYYISYNINKPEEKPKAKEKIFAIYYLDEAKDKKSTLTYYTKNMNTTVDIVTQTTELCNILKRGHANGYTPFPAYSEIRSIDLLENTLTIDLSEQFYVLQPDSNKLKDIAIDCIINTLTQIDGVHNVRLLREGAVVEKFGTKDCTEPITNNLAAYEAETHKDEKIASYLLKIPYQGKTAQIFISSPTTWAAKEVTVKSQNKDKTTTTYSVAGKSTVYTPVMPRAYTEVWSVKKDGLYIDNVKYLDKNSYAGNAWQVKNFKPLLNALYTSVKEYPANFVISDVIYKEEKGKIVKEYNIAVTVPTLKTMTGATYIENITFREGQGIYKRNIIDPTSSIHSRLDVQVK